MSAFAQLLRARGHRVSGCDEATGAHTEALSELGIRVAPAHDPAHVTGSLGPVDVVVATEALSKDHPELVAARAAGVAVRPRMALLGELLAAGPSVGVIGTHGKTTTTAMIAMALYGAGLDPSAFVGGLIHEFGGNARVGAGPFVAEVDESDRGFAELSCETAVFTNAEGDHVGGKEGGQLATYWESAEEQNAAFERFVGQARRVLYCADWPGLGELLGQAGERLSYGQAEGADYRAENLRPDAEGTSFTVTYRGEVLAEARTPMPGTHNALNALAALAVTHLYGGDVARAAQTLREFAGPGRRWQRRGEVAGAPVIDDYAHNPTKLAAAVQAGRQTGRRVRVVFQPHRPRRTEQSWREQAQALMPADEVLVLDIASASEPDLPGIHATLISDRMQALGHPAVRYVPDRQEVVPYLRQSADAGDLLLFLGAGDVWRLAAELGGETL